MTSRPKVSFEMFFLTNKNTNLLWKVWKAMVYYMLMLKMSLYDRKYIVYWRLVNTKTQLKQ